MNIWQENVLKDNDTITISVKLEINNKLQNLWYRYPIQYENYITSSLDPFVVACVLPAMNRKTDLKVYGEVSPSLLQNITEFQMAWNCLSTKHKVIDIVADIEKESEIINSDEAVCAFSVGVDSCFTAWRHATNNCGKVKRNIKAGMLIHGFDIPLNQEIAFNNVKQNAKKILDSISLDLITVSSNYRQIFTDWGNEHAIAIVAAMMLLKKKFSVGLLASSYKYDTLEFPWGSTPITDHLLSSKTFDVIHDAAAFDRLEKIEKISKWKEALNNLKVCWQKNWYDKNCCECEKCVRTILMFRLIGVGLPSCFYKDVSNEQIEKTTEPVNWSVELEHILKIAKSKNITESWVKSLEICIERMRRNVKK